MVAAATSAADAPDVSVGGTVTSGSVDVTTEGLSTSWGGVGPEQWWKIALDRYTVVQATVAGAFPGDSDDHYLLRQYTSTRADEDGTTLVQQFPNLANTIGGDDGTRVCNTNTPGAGHVWLYLNLTEWQGGVGGTATLDWTSTAGDTNHDLVPGTQLTNSWTEIDPWLPPTRPDETQSSTRVDDLEFHAYSHHPRSRAHFGRTDVSADWTLDTTMHPAAHDSGTEVTVEYVIVVPPPPEDLANDDIAEAYDLTGSPDTTLQCSTVNYTLQAGEIDAPPPLGASAWFKLTAPTDGLFGFAATLVDADDGTPHDCRIDIYTGGPDFASLTQWESTAHASEHDGVLTCRATIQLFAGTTYLIRVADWANLGGYLTFDYPNEDTGAAAFPGEHNSATVVELLVSEPPDLGNDDIANAYELLGTETRANTVGYGMQAGEPEPIGPGMATAWFTWTAPSDGDFTISFAGSAAEGGAQPLEGLLAAYTGYDGNTWDSLNPLVSSCGDPQVEFTAVDGQVIWLQLMDFGGAGGWMALHYPEVFGVTRPDTTRASTAVAAGFKIVGVTATLDDHDSFTYVHIVGVVPAQLDDHDCGTEIDAVRAPGAVIGTPDTTRGSTLARVIYTPDLSENPPVSVAFDMTAEMLVIPPEDDGPSPEYAARYGQPTGYGYSERRLMPVVSATLPTPVIVNGLPMVPRWLPVVPVAVTAREGAAHIHATDPAPVWNARRGGWDKSPPGPKWAGRWVVDDLPDPPTDGYYWLGDPSGQDGTSSYSGGRTKWAAHASTPHAPGWRSFFPYKPSVRAFDSYLPDGGVVHHPKGVHFNSQYVEHMWLEFGSAHRQPFTWVIAAMIVGNPSTHYTHYLLDSGRNPDKVHFPRLSAEAVYSDHTINDGLAYRNLMSYSRDVQKLSASATSGNRVVRADAHAAFRPRMYFGVFGGAHSITGAWGTGAKPRGRGRIANGTSQRHRYYVMGRANGHISQDLACHMMVFEIRFWNSALSTDDLERQYKQLSSTYHFARYRSV